MNSIDQSLKRLATELLHQLYLTFIPLQIRAASMQTRNPAASAEFRSQDNMPLENELHRSSLQVYQACVKLLSMVHGEDDDVDQALSALGTWPCDGPECRDLGVVGNLMLGNVERALRVLSPNLPFDIFNNDQRLPNEV
ncbi:MAG: hypothetical protein M3O30_09715 [Planctomycetota bacterium]|nr:hypothetical protein [Planctomycetota bacterium]